jgi:hypothetical protein
VKLYVRLIFAIILCLTGLPSAIAQSDRGPVWERHTIDNSSRGADRIRIADINRDGHPDFVTGWEEGGQIRIAINPGPKNVKAKWPSVLVGSVASPEDAVFVDLDRDGAIDVVSSCEGKTRKMFVHWSPREESELLNHKAWATEPLSASEHKMMWMFCLPMQIDGQHGLDLIGAGKGPGAKIGWFQSPADARKLEQWTWYPIYDAGWIMSLYARDVDGDGDQDIITTDRKGKNRGCHWLENPGDLTAQQGTWNVHSIQADHEAMFATLVDVDQDGMEDIVACAKKPEKIHFYRRTSLRPPNWETHIINMPAKVGGAKAVEAADVDNDGHNDLIVTCEGAKQVSGMFWMSYDTSPTQADWTVHEIAGTRQGIKYDIVRMIDLDHDGDLDAITCEERDNLGVFWYENPLRSSTK